jgi:hypothetical protein
MDTLEKIGRWLAPGESPEPKSADLSIHAKPLLASLMTMAWFVEARDPYTREDTCGACQGTRTCWRRRQA